MPGLRPADIVTVLCALILDGEKPIADTALGTFSNLPPPILSGALGADLPEAVIEVFAKNYTRDHQVIEKLLRMPRIGTAALERLADAADEAAGELIATNERLMLQNPTVIEKLYMNKRVRMSTAERLLELAVRNGLELGIAAFKEAAAAIQDQLIPEPTEEPTFDDVLFVQTEQIARQCSLDRDEEDTHERDEEGEERLRNKFVPLYAQISQMTVSQKIRRAQLGTAAERLLLVRDANRLVSSAAAKSPLMRENEAVQVTASRTVSDDVLRIIAQNREFTRNYQVKLNLVTNPRTPFSFASRLVPYLRDNDLRALSRSKNITGAVSSAIGHQLEKKQGKER
jgi:hypothetical protein